MKKFTVSVAEVTYHDYTVEARNADEAKHRVEDIFLLSEGLKNGTIEDTENFVFSHELEAEHWLVEEL